MGDEVVHMAGVTISLESSLNIRVDPLHSLCRPPVQAGWKRGRRLLARCERAGLGPIQIH
jgi:hypothetical protein